jgi:hypothetical protein
LVDGETVSRLKGVGVDRLFTLKRGMADLFDLKMFIDLAWTAEAALREALVASISVADAPARTPSATTNTWTPPTPVSSRRP